MACNLFPRVGPQKHRNVSVCVCVAYSVAYLLHPPLLVQICCARKGSTVLFEEMMALMRLPCAVLMTKETSIIVWIIMKHEN